MKTVKFNDLSIHLQYKAIKLMSDNGSSFEGSLADLFQVADLKNQDILYKSFKNVFNKWAIDAKNLYGIA